MTINDKPTIPNTLNIVAAANNPKTVRLHIIYTLYRWHCMPDTMAWHVYKHNCLVGTIAQRRECAVYLQNKKKPGTISRGYPPEMVFVPYVYSGRTHQLAPLYYYWTHKTVWFVPGSSYYHFVPVKQNPVITSPLQLLMICSGYERKSVMIKLG